MANEVLTLLDIARLKNPDGSIDTKIVEVLNESNEILWDAPHVQCNNGTQHVFHQITDEPSGQWFKFNDGFEDEKFGAKALADTCGMLGTYSEVDYEMWKQNKLDAGWRFNKEKTFISGLSKTMAGAMFYADATKSPEKIHGFAPRYAKMSTAETNLGYNILSGDGTGADNTSMWLIGWAPEKVHCLYPEGTQPMYKMEDLGRVTKEVNGKKREVVRSYHTWYNGICVEDWRFVIRIANIDKSDLATAGDATDTSCNLLKLMIQAIDRLPQQDLAGVKLCFYARQHVHTALKMKLLSKGNLFLSMEDFTTAGNIVRKRLSFMGVPVGRVDQLSDAESVVS